MIFSFTGIAYLFLFLGLGFLTYRFFNYWQQARDTLSKLFLFLVIPITFFTLVKAIAALFFIENTKILIFSINIGPFLQSLSCAVAFYIVFYRKFPKISPWFGFSIIFIMGLISTYLITLLPKNPSLMEFGVINWGTYYSTLNSFLRPAIFLFGWGALLVLLFQDFKASSNEVVKKRCLGLALILLLGILIGVLDFLLIEVLDFAQISRDIILMLIGIGIFIVVLATQKPTPKYVTKVR